MAVAQFQVTLWIELLAAGLGGVQGALFAAGRKDRRIDVLGVIVIGLTVALGGSLLRDIVLNQPPVVVWVNWYLLVAGVSAILGMALQPIFARTGWLITVLDAIVMGLFGAIAASKALSLGVGSVGALVVGVVGAIGGGVLRDLILNRPISILHVGSLYAVAAGTGAAALIVLVKIDTPVPIAGLISAAVTTTVRLAAVFFDWTFPEQRALRSGRPVSEHRPHRPGTSPGEGREPALVGEGLACLRGRGSQATAPVGRILRSGTVFHREKLSWRTIPRYIQLLRYRNRREQPHENF